MRIVSIEDDFQYTIFNITMVFRNRIGSATIVNIDGEVEISSVSRFQSIRQRVSHYLTRNI